jgi:hypothetical protein
MLRALVIRSASTNYSLPAALASCVHLVFQRAPIWHRPRLANAFFVFNAFMTWLAISSASAVEFKLVAPYGERPALSISGEILPGDTERALPWLIRLSEGNIAPRLFLNSPGGNIFEAKKFADLIHKTGMPVFVQAGDMCASACFLLFAASPRRNAALEAMIGVHSASIDGDESPLSWSIDTEMAREAHAYGVPLDVIGKMVTTEPSDMAWLTADELHEMDVRPIASPPREVSPPTDVPALSPSSKEPATHDPPQTKIAAQEPGADEPWDGISYRPAQLGASAQPIDPQIVTETAQQTVSSAALRDGGNKPDYVAQGSTTISLPDYVPGR